MDVSFRWLAVVFFALGALQAHELDVATRLMPPTVVLRAAYGGSEAVAFAKVQVFSPADGKTEYQTGMTDRRGGFSFLPDAPGEWRVIIDDETGHKREVTVAVPAGFAEGAAAPAGVGGGSSRLERAVLGMAILFGITGALYGWKARQAG
jgi:nickel transport protein